MAQIDRTITIDTPENDQSLWLVTGGKAIRLDAGDSSTGISLLSEREFEVVKALLDLARNRVAHAAIQQRTRVADRSAAVHAARMKQADEGSS